MTEPSNRGLLAAPVTRHFTVLLYCVGFLLVFVGGVELLRILHCTVACGTANYIDIGILTAQYLRHSCWLVLLYGIV